MDNSDRADHFCNFCNKCNLDPPSAKEVELAKEYVDRISQKKVNTAMNISNNLKLKLRASRAATKIYHKCCIGQNDRAEVGIEQDSENKLNPSPQDQQSFSGESFSSSYSDHVSQPIPNTLSCASEEKTVNNINMSENLMVTGFDVCSLYPSLRDIDTACIARETMIHSDVDFKGMDYKKALVYLRIVAGKEAMESAGLKNIVPKWRGDKIDSLRVTGTSGKNLDNWIFYGQEPSDYQKRLILGLIVEVGVLLAMGSHVFEFGGKFYLQLVGGPIGLALTAWLASIIMKAFDNLWLQTVISNGLKFLDYMRYVDDSRSFLFGISKGWTWTGSKFEFSEHILAKDLLEMLPDDQRTTNLLVDAMSSIMPFLNFTGESASDFDDQKLPTLDCSIFVKNG